MPAGSRMRRSAGYTAPDGRVARDRTERDPGLMSNIAIVWFRNDLRLADQPALASAIESGAGIVPLFIHSPGEAAPWSPGGASRVWLHHSLSSLANALAQRGSRLVIRSGRSIDCLLDIVDETGAGAVYANENYEPALHERDREVHRRLAKRKVPFILSNGSLLTRPDAVATKEGKPYRVFTPFWKNFLRQAVAGDPLPAPARIPAPPGDVASGQVEALDLLPHESWARKIMTHWQPGEVAAGRVLESLDEARLAGYPTNRDLPGTAGTTRLSPYLHFGEISPRQVMARLEHVRDVCRGPGVATGADAILRQLVWRDFAHHVLRHFPHTTDAPMNQRFAEFPWCDDPRRLEAWQRGETGIPIVDAGMRELWQTGWMHNRVRMICASLLTKNLRIHWREGARWFWDTLVDADLAQNSMNWQWVAGSGVDAAPYFRIFNPVTQGLKFDAEGGYVRRWVPELAGLPGKWIHQPWQAPAAVLRDAGVEPGEHYPLPIVDLKQTRDEALAAWRDLG
jgi:deoxyribodipyrimidine photo-lyase